MESKSDFEEADAAIQEAGAKDKYEYEARNYTKVSEEVELATQKMTDCKVTLEDFPNKMEPVIKGLSDACTIKLTEKVRKEYNTLFDNACNKMVIPLKRQGRRAEKRIKDREDRKTISEPLFYCMWWIIVMLSLFFSCVCYANYEFLHLDMMWKMVVYIGAPIVVGGILIIFYCKEHTNN